MRGSGRPAEEVAVLYITSFDDLPEEEILAWTRTYATGRNGTWAARHEKATNKEENLDLLAGYAYSRR